MKVHPKLTLLEIQEILAKLNGETDIISDEELFNYIDLILIGLPFLTLKFKNGALFRARPNIGEELFTNTKELWNPRTDWIKKNRFNDEKTEILYVSEAKSTVVEEVKPPPGSLLTLTTYVPVSELTFLPTGIQSGVTKTQLFTEQYFQNILLDKMKHYDNNPEYLQIDETINKYLYEQVTKENSKKDPNEYRFTNIYGKHVLLAPIDGLLYPSISRKLFDINIALKGESTCKLKIIQVEVIRMDPEIINRFELVACSNEFSEHGDIIYNGKCGSFDEMMQIEK
jgi:RES domain